MKAMCITFAIVDALVCVGGCYIARRGTSNAIPYRLISSAMGIGAVVLMVAGIASWKEDIVVPLVALPFFGMFLLPGLWQIICYFRCTLAVTAVCEGEAVLFDRRKGFPTYAALFAYHIDGKKYQRAALTGCSDRRWKRLYTVGKSYIVHVNPHHPEQCIDKRCFPVGTTVAVVISAALCLLCLSSLI